MFKRFIIHREEWTDEDSDDMKMLTTHPNFHLLKKLIGNRIDDRKEDLVNGKETRDRIDELRDLLLEIAKYENTR